MGIVFTRYFKGLMILLACLAYITPAAAQQCSVFNNTKNLDFNQPRKCAPTDVTIGAEFGSLVDIDFSTTTVEIEIDWGNGVVERFPATKTYTGSEYLYSISGISYTYPKGGDQCVYEVYVRPVIDGDVCSIELSANATVWDTDDENGGEIYINPEYYFICAGETADITFYDESMWNCTPPDEDTNMNWPQRWTQFIYGTSNNAAYASDPRISGILIDGVSQTYPFYETIEEHIGTEDVPPTPTNQTYAVSVPATANVGEVFEITLRNWNQCNPYDDPVISGGPADPVNGDYAPVMAQAIIIVIDRPTGAIQTKNKDSQPATDFCPDERIRFEGTQTNPAITNNGVIGWEWEVYDNASGTGSALTTSTDQNFWFEDGFSTPGQKLVRLTVRNKQSSTGNCRESVEQLINIIAPPTIDASINGATDNPFQVCFDKVTSSFTASFDYSLYSDNNYQYRFGYFTDNSTAATPDAGYSAWTDAAAATTTPASYSDTYTQPGVYRLWMEVQDKVTGCSTIDERKVVIYDTPEAAFTVNNLCVGQPSIFENLTAQVAKVLDDSIKTYAWDVDYDAVAGFSADYSGKEAVTHQYTAAGTYEVALQVITEAGCSDMLVQEVTVYPVPDVLFSSDYTDPLCPGEVITFTNNSPAVNTAALFPEGVNYRLYVQDPAQGSPNDYVFTDNEVSIPFFNNTDSEKIYQVWIRAVAGVPNGCGSYSDTLDIHVKPGAQLAFYEPTFNPLLPNCSPKDLMLITTQDTRDLDVDQYTWTVYKNGVQQGSPVVQNKGEAGFDTLYVATENNSTGYANYTVRLEGQKGTICLSPALNTYGISPKPAADFTITEIDRNCEQMVFQVQVTNPTGISNYSWDFYPVPENSASLVADDAFELVYDRPDENSAGFIVDVELTTENSYGCYSNTVKQQTEVFPQEIVGIGLDILTPAPYTSCSPFTVDFRNTTSAYPPETEFALIIRRGSGTEQEVEPTSGSITGDFAYTFTDAGSYQVKLRATANGCTRFYTFPDYVVVTPDPEPFFDLDTKLGCGPLEVGFIKNISAASHTYTITNLNSGEVVLNQEFNPSTTDNLDFFTFENSGSTDILYEVKVAALSDLGCTADSTIEVRVKPQPEAALELLSDANLCPPYELQVRNNSSNIAGTTYTIFWGDGTSQEMTETELSHSYTNNSFTTTLNYNVRLVTTSPNGCSTEQSLPISILPKLQASYTADRLAGCAPLFVNLTNTSQGHDPAQGMWLIKKTSDATYTELGSSLSSYTFENTTNSPIDYQLKYLARNSAGNCPLSYEKVFTVNPAAALDFTVSPLEGCAGYEVTLTNNDPKAGTTYSWDWGDGSPVEITDHTVTQINHIFENSSYTNTRQFTIRATADNGSGCTANTQQEVVVFPSVLADVSLSESAGCSPFMPSVTNSSQGVSAQEWQLLDSDNTVLATSTALTPDFSAIENTGTSDQTYRIVYTGNNGQGCSDEQTLEFVVHPQVIADFVPESAEGCDNSAFSFTNLNVRDGVSYSWNWGDGSAEETSAEASLTHVYENLSYSSSRTYTVTLTATDDATECTATSQKQVTVYPKVLANAQSLVTEGCAPLSLQFTNQSQGANTHRWTLLDPAGTVLEESSEIIPSFADLTNSGNTDLVYTVNYQAENSSGCIDEQEFEIRVHPQVIADFVPESAAGCDNSAFSFTNLNVREGVTYSWSWGDGSAEETSAEASLTHVYENISYSSPRTYTVTLTATDDVSECSAISQQQVTVYPKVLASVQPLITEGCAPLSLQFTNQSQGASIHRWTLLDPAGTVLEESSEIVPSFSDLTNSGNTDLVYTVSYQAENNSGCIDEQEFEITVHPQVIADFATEPAAGCSNATFSFTNLNMREGVSYSWNWGDGSPDEESAEASLTHVFQNISYSSPKTFTVTLTATDEATACSAVSSQQLTVYPNVQASVQPLAAEGCAPMNLQVSNQSRGATMHRWTLLDQNGAVLQELEGSLPTFQPLENNSAEDVIYTVRYAAINAEGCSDSQEFEVVVHPRVTADFNSSETSAVCGPAEITFTNLQLQEGVRYVWNWGDGTASDTTYAEETVTHTFYNNLYDRNRNYEVRLYAQDTLTGCSVQQTETISVLPTWEVATSPDKQEGCAPFAVNFLNESRNISSHRWYYRPLGSSEILEEQTSFEAQFNLANTTSAPLQYEVIYEGTTAAGCTESQSHLLTVYPELNPSFTTDSVRVRLPNTTFQIENTTPHANSWETSWEFGDGTGSDEAQPGSHSYPGYGEYTIKLTVSNGFCSETVEQTVRVLEILPVVDFESIPVSGCSPLTVSFKNLSQYADTTSYLWDFGDGEGYSRDVNPTHTFYRPGEYTVTLTASNPSGEAVSQRYNIVTVYDQPRADFTLRETVVYVPDEPVYVANYSQDATEFFWDFGDGTTSEEFEPVHYYQEPGQYTISLIASNEWGCADTLVREQVVTAEGSGDVRIPNAFTPSTFGSRGGLIDGAGENDVFYPVLEGGVVSYHLRIYNRWGELMYETRDKNYGWDGYYKGVLCKSDVYVYKLAVEFIDGRSMNKIGDLTLIR